MACSLSGNSPRGKSRLWRPRHPGHNGSSLDPRRSDGIYHSCLAGFVLSICALAFRVWAVSHRQFEMGPEAARVIFFLPELDGGLPEDTEFLRSLERSSRAPALLLYLSAMVWLLIGSLAGS